MKFMTPATLRNLPNYMMQQQKQTLLNREEDRYQHGQEMKNLTAQIGFEMLKATKEAKDQEDLFRRFDEIKARHGGKVPPEVFPIASNLAQKFGQEMIEKEDRQKQTLNEQTANADATAASGLLGKIAGIPGNDSVGGDEYSVPITQQDYLLSMSPKSRLGMTDKLLDFKAGEAEAKRQADKDALNERNILSQIDERGRPKFTAKTLYTPDGSSSVRVYSKEEEADARAEGYDNKRPGKVGAGQGGTASTKGLESYIADQVKVDLDWPTLDANQRAAKINQWKREYGAITGQQGQGGGGNSFDDLHQETFGGQVGTQGETPQVPDTKLLDDTIAGQTGLFGGASQQSTDYGLRKDGTPKGGGFLGEIKDNQGRPMTELSIGVEFDGEETEIPLLVPTLTKKEIEAIKAGDIPDSAVDKAVEHAKKRIAEGKSPFAETQDPLALTTSKEKRNRPIGNPNASPDELKKAAQSFMDAGESFETFVKEWGIPALQTAQKLFLTDPLKSAGSVSQWVWKSLTDAQKKSIDRLTGL